MAAKRERIEIHFAALLKGVSLNSERALLIDAIEHFAREEGIMK